ncbi:Pr6Pr family membrane protein [Corynebacterium pseudotuberculosis]|uniref:Pr6Pr family membrane protein n=1 Tax=Corynebacterium pseudotuberculosis TaxID=1719 RepID=UPI002417A547|nr:Pr6Pr family membrane protein [Corynebacterium pseudotuberculosis]WFP66893.1 Pr6Pr family membrane protein [Corynebacterium pseudotuberculosis]
MCSLELALTKRIVLPVNTLGRLFGLVGLIGIVIAGYQTATEPFTDWPAFDTPAKALIAEFSFFTMWSNIVGTFYLLRAGRTPCWLTVDAVSMLVVTGVVYNTLLGGELHGLWAISSPIQHTFMPIAVPLYWLLTIRGRPTFQLSSIIGALGIPVIWSILTFYRGATTGWYPYFFIDATNLGLPIALRNMAGVYLGFFILAIVLAFFERLILWLRRRTKTAAAIAASSL